MTNLKEINKERASIHFSLIKERQELPHEIQLYKKLNQIFRKMSTAVPRAYKGGMDIEKAIEAWDEEFFKAIYTSWMTVFEVEGSREKENIIQQGDKMLQKGKISDFMSNKVKMWIKKITGQKVTGVSQTTKDAIKRVILQAELSARANGHRATTDHIAKRIGERFKDFSVYRAGMIARTEIGGAIEEANHEAQKQAQEVFGKGVIVKRMWMTAKDERVRTSHREAEGQIVGLDEPFIVGGAELMKPKDYGAGAPSQTINCRCRTKTILEKAGATAPKPVEVDRVQAIEPKAPKKVTYGSTEKRAHVDKDKYFEGYGTEWDDVDERHKRIAKDLNVSEDEAKKMMKGVYKFSGSAYSSMRKQAIGQAKYHDEYLQELIDGTEDFIKKSPKWNGNGTLYRGISTDKPIEGFKEGNTINMQGMASWSSTERVAESFAQKHGREHKYIVELDESMTSTSIRHISQYDTEDEVLMPTDTDLIIVKIEERQNKYDEKFTYVLVKEKSHGKR